MITMFTVDFDIGMYPIYNIVDALQHKLHGCIQTGAFLFMNFVIVCLPFLHFLYSRCFLTLFCNKTQFNFFQSNYEKNFASRMGIMRPILSI